jgi:UPF0755 protein
VKGRRTLAIGALIVLVVLAGGGVGAYGFYSSDLKTARRAGQPTVEVVIPPGTSVSGVARILQGEGIIGNPLVFEAYVRTHGYASRLEAGHYQVPGGLDVVQVVELLGHASGSEVTVTIPEGYTKKQAADVMEHAGLLKAADYVAAVDSPQAVPDFLSDRPAGAGLEGFLFPDTYRFAPQATAAQVVAAQLARFGEVVTPDLRARAANQKLTLYQAVVLASIIEREARFDDDRPQIAAVFYNRLSIGMALEADATLLYARGATSGEVTAADKQSSSPYNTYANKGLPPGPICSPGLAAIRAALEPAQNDYLFYLTDKDGHAHFSRTLAEHQQKEIEFGLRR